MHWLCLVGAGKQHPFLCLFFLPASKPRNNKQKQNAKPPAHLNDSQLHFSYHLTTAPFKSCVFCCKAFFLPTAFPARIGPHPPSLPAPGGCLLATALLVCSKEQVGFAQSTLAARLQPHTGSLGYHRWPSLAAVNNWPWFNSLAGKFGCGRELVKEPLSHCTEGLSPAVRLQGLTSPRSGGDVPSLPKASHSMNSQSALIKEKRICLN